MAKAKKKIPPHMQRDSAGRKKVEGTRRGDRPLVNTSGGRDQCVGDPGYNHESAGSSLQQ